MDAEETDDSDEEELFSDDAELESILNSLKIVLRIGLKRKFE